MKKMIIILSPIIVVTGIVLFIFMKNNIIRKEMKISFIIAKNHTSQDLSDGFLNSFEWVIISNENQKRKWEDAGYIIPFVNFEKNYIIISRYKILKLYQKAGKSECTGVPDGEVVFDKEGSDSNLYYIYLMPNLMLSQGVG